MSDKTEISMVGDAMHRLHLIGSPPTSFTGSFMLLIVILQYYSVTIYRMPDPPGSALTPLKRQN